MSKKKGFLQHFTALSLKCTITIAPVLRCTIKCTITIAPVLSDTPHFVKATMSLKASAATQHGSKQVLGES